MVAVEEELPYRPRSTAWTAGSSSSRREQPSHHSNIGSSGTRVGSASRGNGEAPSAYQTFAPNIPKGTKLQLDDAEDPQEQSIIKGPRPSFSRRTQESSVVKQRPACTMDRKQYQYHYHERAQDPLYKSKEAHPSSSKKSQGPTVTKCTPSVYQPSSHSSRRNQEPSIVKQPIHSQKQPSQHQFSRRTQEPTVAKQPLSSSREQLRQPASIRKEPLSSMRQERSQFKSKAPPTAKSILVTPEDIQMASRQTRIESLPPKDRQTQERWAQGMIKRAGVCPEHYAWRRMSGGYQCEGGGHGITDELLAEGKGGMMAHRTRQWGVSDGPYYPHPNNPGRWLRYDGEAGFRGD